ncbi:L-arabinolactonase [Caballeronia sordidicola]|uniref:L-arabinolactonase n=1 Tax=Caballeronia sordidicola TaxID=196367 RepID=A0A242N9V1_CABSO|nr:L-arabinolactonase [Caballeronia sordidicola]
MYRCRTAARASRPRRVVPRC